MKHLLKRFGLFLYIIIGLAIGLVSCTEEYLESELLSTIQTGGETHGKGESQRSINRILAISDSVLDNKTRGIVSIKTMTPVVEGKDTVAYIINYPNNKGFTIISTYNAVPAVLAYSKKHSFSLDNEAANLYFVNNIKSYTDDVIKNAKQNASIGHCQQMDTIFYIVPSIIEYSLEQSAPYNNVVTKYHPGCKVGCAPVAAALIMAYCKTELTYKNKLYNFKAINKALAFGDKYNPLDTAQIAGLNVLIEPVSTWPITYEGSMNATSDLLYEIGKLMNCRYGQSETTAVFG